MRKSTKSLVAAIALVVVASLGAPATAAPAGPNAGPRAWCC